MSDEPEIVSRPPGARPHRSQQLASLYDAAVAASAQGKAIRIRAESHRDRDAIRSALSHRARTNGTRAHFQAGTNLTVLVWIDTP